MRTIDITDTNAMLRFGTDVQIGLAEISKILLTCLRETHEDEVVSLLGDLLGYLDELGKAGWFGTEFARARKRDTLTVEGDYEAAVVRVEEIAAALEDYQVELAKERAMFDMISDMGVEYEKQLNEVRETVKNVIRELKTGNKYAKADRFTVDNAIKCLSKRADELELSATVANRQLATIQVLRDNLADVSVKLQTALYSTIPLWKDQIVLTVDQAYTIKKVLWNTPVSEQTNGILIDSLKELVNVATRAGRSRKAAEKE